MNVAEWINDHYNYDGARRPSPRALATAARVSVTTTDNSGWFDVTPGGGICMFQTHATFLIRANGTLVIEATTETESPCS